MKYMVVIFQLPSVYVSTDSLNCIVSFRNRLAPRLASVFSSCFFLIGLSAISLNYFQIIRHVKRKFSKRKARGNFLKIIVTHFLLHIPKPKSSRSYCPTPNFQRKPNNVKFSCCYETTGKPNIPATIHVPNDLCHRSSWCIPFRGLVAFLSVETLAFIHSAFRVVCSCSVIPQLY